MTDVGIRGDHAARVSRRRAAGERTTTVRSRARVSAVSAHGGALARMLAIGLALSAWLGGCAAPGSGETGQRTDVESLTAHLKSFAYEQLTFRTEKSSPLSPPVQYAIDEFIASGARRLYADGATARRIATAENNLERFTSALSEAADRGEGTSITPATVESTRNRLCPLYPFC